MPAPYFTTDSREFTRLEGLYIFEKNPPTFIKGVELGVVAVAGETLRGPVDTPVEITSEARFIEVFGHRSRYGSTTEVNQVRKFLMNKPFGKVVVVRAAASAAATAEKDFVATATPIINVAASSPGAWGNDLTVDIVAASDANANHFDMIVNYRGSTVRYKNLDVTTGNNNLSEVIGSDLANLVVVSKLADGRPDNVAAAALNDTAGADGTIANTDYTAAGRAIEKIAYYKGVGVCAVAETSVAAADINTKMHTEALASNDRLFLIWNGSHSAAASAVVTDAANYRSDRIVYCYNSVKTYDSEAAADVMTAPHSWAASILSQVDVDINIGEEASKAYTRGIAGLQNESLSRSDYISLKDAGVAAWEKDTDGGFLIVSAVVNDLTSGKTEITRRRSADFLQLSAAGRLKFFVKKKNTAVNRAQIFSELAAFSQDLKDAGRVIEEFAIDQKSVNSALSRAQGIEKIYWKVKLIGHMKYLVLETEIGETVLFSETA